MPTMNRLRRTPAKASQPSSISGSRFPFFHGLSRACVRSVCAVPTGSTVLRVWLPSLRCQSLHPWWPVSASNAPGFFPSEPFSHPAIEAKFPLLPPLLRFCAKPFGLVPALQRLSLARRSVPLFAPWVVTPGRGRVLSWVSLVSQALPPPDRLESFSLSSSPSRPLLPPALRPEFAGTSGLVLPAASRLPPWRVRACLTFFTARHPPPFGKMSRLGTIFSSPRSSSLAGREWLF
jgi:hypothetical protein